MFRVVGRSCCLCCIELFRSVNRVVLGLLGHLSFCLGVGVMFIDWNKANVVFTGLEEVTT